MQRDEVLSGLELVAAYLAQPMQDQPALVDAIDAAKAELVRLRADAVISGRREPAPRYACDGETGRDGA